MCLIAEIADLIRAVSLWLSLLQGVCGFIRLSLSVRVYGCVYMVVQNNTSILEYLSSFSLSLN